MPGTSTTKVAALSPRLTAVHPSASDLLAACATELARRVPDMREDDVAYAMGRVRDALALVGELLAAGGDLNDAQYTGDSAACDEAAAECAKAGWEMRSAARHLTAALAARARGR